LDDLTSRAQKALEKPISRGTVWRILDEDAIKPWQYEYWIFPRDPQFLEKAGPILDLYAGHWEGKPLENRDFIVSADEKTSIQARIRFHASLEPGPGRSARIESEYERGGALQYLAAWDVRRGYVMGRCEPTTGIEPFGRLVAQVLAQEPYRSAKRLFWIVDDGSFHRCEAVRTSSRRLILTSHRRSEQCGLNMTPFVKTTQRNGGFYGSFWIPSRYDRWRTLLEPVPRHTQGSAACSARRELSPPGDRVP